MRPACNAAAYGMYGQGIPAQKRIPMNHPYLSLLLLCSVLSTVEHAHAQLPCVTEVDETDPFTKVRVLSVAADTSKANAPGNVGTPVCRWRSVDGSLSLELTWNVKTDETFAVLEGDRLLLELENDSVIQLTSLRSVVATPRVSASGTGMEGRFEFSVPPIYAKLLTKQWVRRIRLYHSSGFLDHVAENDPRWQQSLENLTTCFLYTCSEKPVPSNAAVSQQSALRPVAP